MTAAWQGRRVFLTGHTGFKGGWLAVWLREIGAYVTGYSLAPERESFYSATGLRGSFPETIGDIRDLDALRRAMTAADPEVILHLAAQPLVRASYLDPVGTFATNVMGTVHVLEAARRCSSLRAIVAITTDKVYRNEESRRGYSESDALGGSDPYSGSKSSAEHVCTVYRSSFFAEPRPPLLATARAGNVIGGGDWSADRLIPDIVRASGNGLATRIRSPQSVRPWQHVLEPLAGYLRLAERLLEGNRAFASSWNFGPALDAVHTVAEVADRFCAAWGPEARWQSDGTGHPPETKVLVLDSAKAERDLGWRQVLSLGESVRLTADWYHAHGAARDMLSVTREQIAGYRARVAGYDGAVRPNPPTVANSHG